MASPQDYKFEGWQGLDPSSVEGKMVWGSYEPKAFESNDVDIRVTHCGMCGTDLHMLRSGWYPTPYPVVVGHEIVGTVVRTGADVKHLSVGDRVGVGCQGDSCLSRRFSDDKDYRGCDACDDGKENYCPHIKSTYGGPHFNGDLGQGGYATYHRSPSHFAFRIPDGLSSADAAPMLCGGATAYSPLVHFGRSARDGGLKGLKVGIVGMGGIGHFGVLFAKALGADRVVAVSRRASKRDEAIAVGADEYLATEQDGWDKPHKRSLDLILSTVASAQVPLAQYMGLLRTDGTIVQVGNPDDGSFSVPGPALIMGRVRLAGSLAASPAEIKEMLQLAADKKIKPWIEERPMSDANQALIDLEAGKPRFRYVLVNESAERPNL